MYLDTARLGRTCSSALQAQCDFARLAADDPSMYCEDLFLNGVAASGVDLPQRYPGLAGWQGIQPLMTSVTQEIGAAKTARVYLANRSSRMMSLAARLLFRRCRCVLTTDLNWPAYQELHRAEALRAGQRVIEIPLCDQILQGQLSCDDVIRLVVDAYERNGCDGLFLPVVSNLGVRLPVESIVTQISRIERPRFVVGDAAQAFRQVPFESNWDWCDFLIAGSHKWLRASQPMGLGIVPRPASCEFVDHYVRLMIADGDLDDPLLRFTESLLTRASTGYSETVNIQPLFTTQAAIDSEISTDGQYENQTTAAVATSLTNLRNWKTLLPADGLRSRILLLQSERESVCSAAASEVRQAFQRNGLIATTYDGGRVRLSLPETSLTDDQLTHVSTALDAVV